MNVNDKNRLEYAEEEMAKAVFELQHGLQLILKYVDNANGTDFRTGVSEIVGVIGMLNYRDSIFRYASKLANELIREKRERKREGEGGLTDERLFRDV